MGCGRGILVDYLNTKGIDCYGVGLASVDVPAHLNNRVFAGVTAENLPIAFRASVDTLIFADVIEHVNNPTVFLGSLVAAFPTARALVITVPARKELWSNYDDHYGHYRRYDLESLSSIVNSVGYEPIYLGYLFRLLYLPTRLLVHFGRRRRTELSPPRFRALHMATANVLCAELRFLPNSLYGTSAVCVSLRLSS